VLYRTEAPTRIGRALLLQAVAYRLQERVLGGIKPSTRRLLERVAEDNIGRRPPTETITTTITPGTVLIREWHGASHRVTVLKDGVLLRGARYRSLSEVARKITGSRWSGPRFFGLRAPGKGSEHGTAKPLLRRCAIYTRKSSEEGLEQNFNSLHAQREACEAFIKSQASEGWRLVKTHYDDGGLSGASIERPALQRLLGDIRKGLIEAVLVYTLVAYHSILAERRKKIHDADLPFPLYESNKAAMTVETVAHDTRNRTIAGLFTSFATLQTEK